MKNSYLAEKFNHRQDVIEAINLLESNNFEIDLGFGGEIEGIIDLNNNKPVTGDSVYNYPNEIRDAMLILNEVN
jgi:hypothetical protein